MIKRLFIVLTVLSAYGMNAQTKATSPYSYFGIGLPSFNGTAENRSMQGLSMEADSIHFNIENPAALGALQLTTYTIGATQSFTSVKNSSEKESIKNTTFDYLAVAIPMGKLNAGFGLLPETSVGYRLKDEGEDYYSSFEGRGGLTKLFISLGYQIDKNFRIGLQGAYSFGNVQNANILSQDNVQYGTREMNRSDINGFNFKVAAQYDLKLTKELDLFASATYTPKQKLHSDNARTLATIQSVAGGYTIINEHEVKVENTSFYIPTDIRLGIGLGKKQKWFAGIEYENIGKADYTNTSFSMNNVTFKESNVYRVGGYYIPNYRDLTKYFNRVTYRAGVRYQESGMTLNNQDIDEFGISFGLGLPAGRYLTNFNLGLEYGSRGTTSAGLIKEEFFNVFLGFSLNDKWFIKRKFR